MLTDAQVLPGDARIWIYQSDRPFSEKESVEIAEKTKNFLDSWTSHQVSLKAGFEIRYGIFLIIMLDEKHAASGGCSIDKLFHFIQQLESNYSIRLLDRNIFAFKENGRVILADKMKFEKMVEEGLINDDTVVFNNLIQSRQQLETDWEIAFKESWHRSIL
jgi:hypothetical protein